MIEDPAKMVHAFHAPRKVMEFGSALGYAQTMMSMEGLKIVFITDKDAERDWEEFREGLERMSELLSRLDWEDEFDKP